MKRKIIKLGSSTLVVSLPAKWTKRFNICQGNELVVEERDKELILATERVAPESRKVLDITDLDTKLVERFLVGTYIQGYDEIKLVFKKPEIQNLKTKKPVLTINFIQSIVNNVLISMEVIEQKEDSCIIKDLSQMTATAFEPVVRRIFLLLKGMSSDLLEYVKKGDKERMRNIPPVRDNVIRFANYALRILNKKGAPEFGKSFQYYSIISELKSMAGVFLFISKEFAERKTVPSKEMISAFEQADKSLCLFYDLFYKFDEEIALAIIKSRRTFFNIVNKTQYDPKTSNDDVLLGSRLAVVIVQVLNMSETRISLEM